MDNSCLFIVSCVLLTLSLLTLLLLLGDDLYFCCDCKIIWISSVNSRAWNIIKVLQLPDLYTYSSAPSKEIVFFFFLCEWGTFNLTNLSKLSINLTVKLVSWLNYIRIPNLFSPNKSENCLKMNIFRHLSFYITTVAESNLHPNYHVYMLW